MAMRDPRPILVELKREGDYMKWRLPRYFRGGIGKYWQELIPLAELAGRSIEMCVVPFSREVRWRIKDQIPQEDKWKFLFFLYDEGPLPDVYVGLLPRPYIPSP